MPVGILADLLNIREDGLRLLLCVLAGYDCVHAFIGVLMAYVIINVVGGKDESVIAAHVVLLGYLLVGYWTAESEAYDITWTTPYCIMTLRFTGLIMDIYDGAHFDSLKPDQKKTAIKDAPGFIELAAYGLFYTGTIAGPQFSLSKFRAYVNGDWLDEKRQPRQSSLMPSLGRFIGGCTYMVLNQWGAVWIPDTFFNSQEFFNMSFFMRWTWVMIWFRLTMYRYCAVWLIVEGACILNGIGYNGKDEEGNDRWDGVRDVHIWLWETGHDFSSAIQSFNCGTNAFAKNHVFRRLRWLGSKATAHIITLGYLAIWHGYHLGYFFLFFYEFGCVVAQEQLYSLINNTPGWAEFITKPAVRPFVLLFGRLITMYSMGFGFLCFGLVKTKYWIGPLKSLYFVGFIIYFAIWPIIYHTLKRVLPKKPRSIVQENGYALSNNVSKKDL
ncbi:MBOAT family protein [Dictyocaulus viviparus]|uniref:Lysophospholipid acyltransferase 5 n=1 Tax=Dictyocaulus viviparus TaxID=29172 RepID=A0A0D8XA46_DICVI|nr:MBOAT family protein [Dictyocaulus viviparus]